MLSPLWSVVEKGDPLGLAVLSTGRVLSASKSGIVRCRLPSGRTAWSRDLASSLSTLPLHRLGGEVLVVGQPVRRLDPATGRTLAERDLGPLPNLRSSGRLATAWQEREGTFLVLDPSTLAEVARWPDASGSVSLHAGTFCCRAPDGSLGLHDLRTGIQVGRMERLDGIHVHHRTTVCFLSPEDWRCTDFGGGVVWRRPALDASVAGYATRAGSLAVLAGKTLIALDLTTGEVRWRIGLAGKVLGTYQDVLVVAGDSSLHLLDLQSGRERAAATAGMHVLGADINGPWLAMGVRSASLESLVQLWDLRRVAA